MGRERHWAVVLFTVYNMKMEKKFIWKITMQYTKRHEVYEDRVETYFGRGGIEFDGLLKSGNGRRRGRDSRAVGWSVY